METRFCKFCGKLIPMDGKAKSRYNLRMYCGDACRNRATALRRTIAPFERSCPVCGKTFRTIRKEQVYCSRACAYRRMTKNHCPTQSVSWQWVWDTVREFHPDVFGKYNLGDQSGQDAVIAAFDQYHDITAKKDKYAWFYNRFICPDDVFENQVLKRAEQVMNLRTGRVSVR